MIEHQFGWMEFTEALRDTLVDVYGDQIVAVTGSEGEWLRVLCAEDVSFAEAAAYVQAHDPVFMSITDREVQAGSGNPATVHIRAGRADHAPVVLILDEDEADPVEVTVEMVSQEGTLDIYFEDVGRVKISVKDGGNRNRDILDVRGV